MTYVVVWVLVSRGRTVVHRGVEMANGNRAIGLACEHASAGERAWIESSSGQVVWPAGV